jgi:uncharacterized protein (TIRG00374 family)
MVQGKKKLIGWAVSALFLALVFRHVEWAKFLESLALLSPFEPLVLALIYLFGFLLRGVRSKILLPSLGWREAFGGVFVGYATNNVLPARLGEVVRAHVVGKSAGISRTVAFSSVLVERIFDGSAIVFLLILGSQSVQTLPEWADEVRLASLVLFSAALSGVILIGIFHRLTSSLISRYIRHPQVSKALTGLSEGVALSVRTVPTLLLVIISSLVIWLVESGMFLFGCWAFHLPVSFAGAMFVMAIVNLGVLIPSSPGGLGVFQYFAVLALGLLGVNKDAAAAYAIVVHLAQYLPITVIGLLWLPKFGVKHLSTEGIEHDLQESSANI